MAVDGEERKGPRIIFSSDRLQHPAAFGSVAPLACVSRGAEDQIAVLDQPGVVRAEGQAVSHLAVNRLDSGFAADLADHAEHPRGPLPEPFDQACFKIAAFQAFKSDEQAIAKTRRASVPLCAVGRKAYGGQIIAALKELDEQVSVDVAFDHLDDSDRRRRAGDGDGPATPAT